MSRFTTVVAFTVLAWCASACAVDLGDESYGDDITELVSETTAGPAHVATAPQNLTIAIDPVGAGGVELSDGGLVTIATCSPGPCTYTKDELPATTWIRLWAMPDKDHNAWGWSYEGAGSNPCEAGRSTCDISPHATGKFTALMEPINPLHVTLDGPLPSQARVDVSIYSCTKDCTYKFPAHTTLRVRRRDPGAANECLKFVGWSGACSHSGVSCLVTMETPKTLHARWQKIPGCIPD
jgi:hypothetical protein